jgi:hypothetical protein
VAIHFTSFPAIGYSKFTTLGVLVLIKDLCAMAPTLRIPNPFPGMNGFHGTIQLLVAMMFFAKSDCKFLKK